MKYLSASALALATSVTPALAESHLNKDVGANSGLLNDEIRANMIHAENLIGAEIFAMDVYDDGLWNDNDYYTAVDSSWTEVGNVTDIVFSRDGQMVGVIASMGGWLDMGDTDMLLSLDDLRMVGEPTADGWGNLDVVTRLTEERIHAIEEQDSGWF
jgi:hypothetical protein